MDPAPKHVIQECRSVEELAPIQVHAVEDEAVEDFLLILEAVTQGHVQVSTLSLSPSVPKYKAVPLIKDTEIEVNSVNYVHKFHFKSMLLLLPL